MIKVNNKQAVAQLSDKSMRANKLRNLVAIIAIALTATLFTALFTIGGGMMASIEASTMRQVGTSAHGGSKYMTQAEYDAIKDHPSIKDISYDIIMGFAENPQLSKLSVELRYSEDKNAEWNFCYPEVGTMPVDYKDAAVSTAVLDALGIAHQLGEEVPLDFTVRGQTYHDTFTLCGYWTSDPVASAEELWLSREYVLEHTPLQSVSYNDRADADISGTINSAIWFANSWNIEQKFERVIIDSGFALDQLHTGVNWAYNASELDGQTMMIIGVMLLLILTAGYLIIYNIFYISVAQDIRYYGLLKTIGTTGRQLKTIVRRQALKLACLGIPLGLIVGYLLGVVLMPFVLEMTTMANSATYSANPLIFIGAALFALVTVWISCHKPCRLAARVSPMEALRYNEVSGGRQTSRRSKLVSPVAMAQQNVMRNKKKVLSVVLSLSLGIILMGAVCTLTNSFDMDKYVGNRSISDFSISNSVLETRFELSYVEADTRAFVESLQGIDDIQPVYMLEQQFDLSEAAQERLLAFLEANRGGRLSDALADSFAAQVAENRFSGHLYGANAAVIAKNNQQAESIDWERFATGDYVLVNRLLANITDQETSFYAPGDTVTLSFPDESRKTYTVLAVVNMPYAAGCQHSHLIDLEFILPADEFTVHFTEALPLRMLFDVQADHEEAIEQAVEDYCAASGMSHVSKATFEESFRSTQMMIWAVGGSLGVILGMIGVLNFINAMVTTIISRRRELAMLQSIGMTTRQLQQMLIVEGLIYAAITTAVVLTIGMVCIYGIIAGVAQMTFFITYRLTIWPVLVCLLLLLLIAWAVPMICYHNISKQSVVERLRQAQ